MGDHVVDENINNAKSYNFGNRADDNFGGGRGGYYRHDHFNHGERHCDDRWDLMREGERRGRRDEDIRDIKHWTERFNERFEHLDRLSDEIKGKVECGFKEIKDKFELEALKKENAELKAKCEENRHEGLLNEFRGLKGQIDLFNRCDEDRRPRRRGDDKDTK